MTCDFTLSLKSQTDKLEGVLEEQTNISSAMLTVSLIITNN